MKDVKENLVQWTDWDSSLIMNVLNSTKYANIQAHQKQLLLIIINASYHENALAAIHIKILCITLTYQIF